MRKCRKLLFLPVSMLLILPVFLLSQVNAYAQKGCLVDADWLSRNYVKTEKMIPMRDGIRLYTAIYTPVHSATVTPPEAMEKPPVAIVKSPSAMEKPPEAIENPQMVMEKSQMVIAKSQMVIAKPQMATEKPPIMMVRTPYSLKPYGEELAIRGDMLNYAAEGYILVYQNVRGRYLSEGVFGNVLPLSGSSANRFAGYGVTEVRVHKGNGGCTSEEVDDATDCYDTVEWLLKNTESNGRVGVKGVSYNGFYATMALLSRHPAIVAVSPQAPVTDWFMGDDIHHNGVLCLADACGFGSSMFRDREQIGTAAPGALVKPAGSLYDFYIDKPASYWTKFFDGRLKFWTSMTEHPVYDDFWKERNPSAHLRDIRAAVLVTGGLYDAEDCYGTFRTYNALKTLSPDCELYLALGPWSHGAWNDLKYNHLSDAWFGENSSAYYRDKIEFPFFQHYLASSSPIPKVMVLPSSETMKEAMEGVCTDSLWQRYPSWPPPCVKTKFRLYSSPSSSLSSPSPSSSSPSSPSSLPSSSPSGAYQSSHHSSLLSPSSSSRCVLCSPVNSFVSDPSSPVPYMVSEASYRDKSYMAADQSFASSRPDVLTFTGPDIAVPLHIAGPVKVSLKLNVKVVDSLKNSSVDADIVVKLIDVRPDGYQMLVRGDVMPLRFRNGFETAEPVKNGSKVHLEFAMCDIDHIFVHGHRLAVQLQGSCFPLFAVNMQNFSANPFESSISDGQKLKISVLKGSCIELGVVK